jgi:tetracycline repressor-like protein
VIREHVVELVGQLARIIRDGVAEGAFRTVDPDAAGWAVFRATASFHHPVHAPEWRDPGIDAAFEGVWRLVMEGLRVRDAE